MGVIAGLLVLGAVPDNAFAQTTINFNGFGNGQIIDTEILGLSLSSTGGPINAPVIFDSQLIQGGDPDLNGPPGNGILMWASGNIKNTQLGNLLIVQENDCIDALAGGCDPINNNFLNVSPDDNAAPGKIIVDFQGTDICSWRTALIDIGDGDPKEFGEFKFFLGGNLKATKAWDTQLSNLGTTGDRSANTFDTLTAAGLGSEFDKVEIIFDGSGAVDNITFQECDVIGGHGKVMDKTSLLVSGAQLTSSWMIPLLVSSIGIGVFVVTRK